MAGEVEIVCGGRRAAVAPGAGPVVGRRLAGGRAVLVALLVAVLGWVGMPGSAQAASMPSTPGNVSATATSASSIHVSWAAAPGATAYVVSNGTVSSASLTGTSYDWTGLARGIYMCFTVTAKNAAGQSPWSPYACATTPGVPAAVTATATATSSVSARVSWTASAGATAYVVNNGDISSADVTGTSFDWTAIAPGSYMCFTVAAKNAAGQSPWSPYTCVTTLSTPWCPSVDPTHPSCTSLGAFQMSCDTSKPCSAPVNDYNTVPKAPLDGTGKGPDDLEGKALLTVVAGMRALSWTHAAQFLLHYLDNSGTDLAFDSTEAYHASPNFASAVDATVVQWIARAGRAGTFDSGYLDYPPVGTATSVWGSEDWQNAVGHGFYRAVGHARPDGSWSVTLQLSSYYQFRAGDDFSKWGGAVTIRGADARRLHQIGYAHNFREVGTGTRTYAAEH